MTKRKAIEVAVEAGRIGKIKGCGVEDHFDPYVIAKYALALGLISGRIARLREAAKITDGSAFAVQAHSIGWRKTLENHANALAKKARPK